MTYFVAPPRRPHLFDGRGNRKYLNRLERNAYFRAVKGEKDLLQRTFHLTLLYTGCRVSEGLSLTPQRIDTRGQKLVFETMKRRKRGCFRSVPIPSSLIKLLQRLTEKKPPAKRVWPFSRTTAFRLIKDRMTEANISGAMASPKGLRHGFAIACIAGQVPLPKVQKWLGHARPETTAIYLDAMDEEERELARRTWTFR